MFIDFEGIDGSGKQTQSQLLFNYLKDKGVQTHYFSYPNYNTVYGKIIDNFLHRKLDLSVKEQFLTYLLDMVKNSQKIRNSIEQDHIVITNRFFFSTIAYQCVQGLKYDDAVGIINLLDLPRPDIVIYIDISPEESFKRKNRQKDVVDRFEEDIAFLGSVVDYYKQLMKSDTLTSKWINFDGLVYHDRDQLHKKIVNVIENAITVT